MPIVDVTYASSVAEQAGGNSPLSGNNGSGDAGTRAFP